MFISVEVNVKAQSFFQQQFDGIEGIRIVSFLMDGKEDGVIDNNLQVVNVQRFHCLH